MRVMSSHRTPLPGTGHRGGRLGKVAVQLNEWHRGRTSMTGQDLKARYSLITDRRNKIAHEADLLDGDLEHRRPISDAEVTDAIDWIERIALAIATVLG
jgi:hypothetical protein